MLKKIGFIQTGGIGDLIMILPIADHFEEQGWEIVWPVDSRYVDMFSRAKPSIHFIPVDGSLEDPRPYYFDRPLNIVAHEKCERTVVFYTPMLGLTLGDGRLAYSLKFDEYKYAIAGVPFRKKWELKYERQMEREQALFDSLNIDGPYVCVHEDGADVQLPLPVPADVARDFRVIHIKPLTDSLFDWRLTLERASHLYLIDSGFANLVEQLNLRVPKSLLLRGGGAYSPVFRSQWNFICVDPSDLTAAPRSIAAEWGSTL